MHLMHSKTGWAGLWMARPPNWSSCSEDLARDAREVVDQAAHLQCSEVYSAEPTRKRLPSWLQVDLT